jgi:transcriptional regulator with GAF, ATPase, and Fis domain
VKTLREVKREHIQKVLEENNWDIQKASAILQVPVKSLSREMKKITPSVQSIIKNNRQ